MDQKSVMGCGSEIEIGLGAGEGEEGGLISFGRAGRAGGCSSSPKTLGGVWS